MKQVNEAMQIFPAQFHKNRFHVQLKADIIGVIAFDGEGAKILRLKLGRDEDGNSVYTKPVGNLAYLNRSFDTTNAAAEKVLEHWLGLAA